MENGARPKKTKKATHPMQEIEASSGNVFADLDVPNPEEALAKAELALRICETIIERKLTQAQAAALLGIDQPKVSALIRGKLNGFSTERLFRFLNALGQDVEIIVKPRRRSADRASTRVVCS
jgi:predicted XRE-type DNA-binding protein